MSRDIKPRPQSQAPKSGSRGSTLVGIFVGLILGALVAAGIALYFTASSPFQKPKAEERPVAPPPKPAGGEPIALPGKPGDKPVEKPRFDFYDVLPKGTDALPAPKPEETTEVVKPPKPSMPERTDKAEDGAKGRDKANAEAEAERARAEAALAGKPLAPEKYYLQAGAFEDPSEADNLKARLALMGVEASVQKVELPERGTVHRVRVGPYLGQENMNAARQQLAANGINVAIIKIRPKEPKPVSVSQ